MDTACHMQHVVSSVCGFGLISISLIKIKVNQFIEKKNRQNRSKLFEWEFDTKKLFSSVKIQCSEVIIN